MSLSNTPMGIVFKFNNFLKENTNNSGHFSTACCQLVLRFDDLEKAETSTNIEKKNRSPKVICLKKNACYLNECNKTKKECSTQTTKLSDQMFSMKSVQS